MKRKDSKLLALEKILRSYRSVLVSYSGGVDSAFLAAVAHDTLGDRASCILLDSPVVPRRAVADALSIAERIGIACTVLPEPLLSDEEFTGNPSDRCFFCRKSGAGLLRDHARAMHAETIIDGLNLSDYHQHRPGIRACDEAGIVHPLVDAGLAKEDIREMARESGLPFWNKPSDACLSSRIAYGEPITREKLAMIEASEDLLKDMGFSQVRVRMHGTLARIEVPVPEIGNLVSRREEIACDLRRLGFRYITLDLEGFRSGSMDEPLAPRP